MSKRPTDHLEPSSKKRAQDRQGRKEDLDNEDSEEEQAGEFQKAPEEVLKTRKIIKARRGGGGLASTAAPPGGSAASANEASKPAPVSSNPFAGISLFPAKPDEAPPPALATVSGAGQAPAEAEAGSKDAVAPADDTRDEAATEAASKPAADASTAADQAEGAAATSAPAAAGASDAAAAAVFPQQADKGDTQQGADAAAAEEAERKGSSNTESKPGFAFGGSLAKSGGGGFGGLSGAGGGGFGSMAASGGGFGQAAAASSSKGDSLFGSSPAFAFASGSPAAADGTTPVAPVFGASPSGATEVAKPVAKAVAPAEEVVTGEEDERTVFSGDGTLFEFSSAGWKERGRGEMRVKVNQDGQARIIMRQRGNLRLLLNANLWQDMAVNTMDGGLGATFALYNAAQQADAAEKADKPDESKQQGLSTYAFRVKTQATLTEFQSTIERYKKNAVELARNPLARAV